jgi:LysR family transcriptional regulator for bpeEF and oprC
MSTVCCASPAYLRDHGIPRRPEDLSAHQCVTFLSDRTGRAIDWEFACGEHRVQLALEGVLAVNDHDACVTASLMNLGIVKVANYVARSYLASGQLTQVLEDWTAEQSPISVMYLQSRHLSAKVRTFVDWVSELMQKDAIFQAR